MKNSENFPENPVPQIPEESPKVTPDQTTPVRYPEIVPGEQPSPATPFPEIPNPGKER